MAPQLAWIGLGNMGRGMVKNIADKADLGGKPILIFNRTAARSEKLAGTLGADKVKVASSIEDAVNASDIVFTCLGDDEAVEISIDAALKGNNVKGKLFVDCSTVHPETTDKLAKTIQSAGAEFVAAPVFGAPAAADAGQLVVVLAGSAAQVDKVKPYTTGVMGRAVIDYSGGPHGAATRLKVIGNTFIMNMVETLSEGHTLAEKSGLGPDRLHQFIETMFPGPYTAYSTRMREGDYYKREEPLFAAELARKDIRHAQDLAKASGMEMKALKVADQHLAEVQEHMGARGDISSIYGAVRKESGLKFEN